MWMLQVDKLSGSDDCPFCRWKISIVECFDVHESLLLMLSSKTGFNASPLSIARLERVNDVRFSRDYLFQRHNERASRVQTFTTKPSRYFIAL